MDVNVVKETMWCIVNLLCKCSNEMIAELIGSDMKLLSISVDLLNYEDYQILDHTLEAIYKIMYPTIETGDSKKYAGYIDSRGGFEEIEQLQDNPNKQVLKQCGKVLKCYEDMFSETSVFEDSEPS